MRARWNWKASLTGHAAIRRGIAAESLIRRGIAARKEAWGRLKRATSKSEKARAAIDYVVAVQKIGEVAGDREQAAKDIFALLDSDTPLDDPEDRRDLRRQLQLLFLAPTSPRRQRFADLSHDLGFADVLKNFVRAQAGLSALEAEQEVAEYLGTNVETLRKRKVRARQEMRTAKVI
jgi:hypothetical protein